jgi:Bacterial transcriptional activator domain
VPRPHGAASDVATYQFVVPSAWIDTEDARTSLDRAEAPCGATRRPMRGGRQMSPRRLRVSRSCRMKSTRGSCNSASSCSAWRRALLVLSAVSVLNGECELGIQHAADTLSAEPFDEMACQALMRAHARAGKRAEALRVYANCGNSFETSSDRDRRSRGGQPRADRATGSRPRQV